MSTGRLYVALNAILRRRRKRLAVARDERTDVRAGQCGDDVPLVLEREDANGHLLVAAEREGLSVHDAELVFQAALVGQVWEEHCVAVRPRILVVHAVDVRRLRNEDRANLARAERCGIVRRAVRVARASREDDHTPLFEMAYGLAHDVGLCHSCDIESGHESRLDLELSLDQIEQGETILDRREHPELVGERAIHAVARSICAAEDVASTDHDRNLDTLVIGLSDFLSDLEHGVRIVWKGVVFPEQSLA